MLVAKTALGKGTGQSVGGRPPHFTSLYFAFCTTHMCHLNKSRKDENEEFTPAIAWQVAQKTQEAGRPQEVVLVSSGEMTGPQSRSWQWRWRKRTDSGDGSSWKIEGLGGG